MKIYIETSVPNFLFSKQDSKEKQQITEKFFKEVLPQQEAFVSDVSILEAEQAPPEKAKQLKSNNCDIPHESTGDDQRCRRISPAIPAEAFDTEKIF